MRARLYLRTNDVTKSEIISKMPCFGTYEKASYACVTACNVSKECKEETYLGGVTAVEQLPEYLTHRDPDVRKAAAQKFRELKGRGRSV